jgi:hypothetical protein
MAIFAYILGENATEVLRTLTWPIAMVICLVAIVFTIYHFQKQPVAIIKAAEGIAEKFKSGSITETFIAAIPHLLSDGAGNLEVCAYEVTESLVLENDQSVFFGLLPLGKITTKADFKVTYRYHICLHNKLRLDVQDNTIIVYPSSVCPTLPPAVHTDTIKIIQAQSLLRFDGAEQKDLVIKRLTPVVSRFAEEHLAKMDINGGIIMDNARKSVAEFVQKWLIGEGHWKEGRFTEIKVHFPNDKKQSIAAVKPVLQLKHVY